jgi:hypothetical protein
MGKLWRLTEYSPAGGSNQTLGIRQAMSQKVRIPALRLPNNARKELAANNKL